MVMAIRMEGRVALVTGAAKGLGRAIALKLADAGADVAVLTHQSRVELEGVASEIRARGRRSVALVADVSLPADADRAVAEAVGALGRLDVLVNNAGYSARRSWGSDIHAIDLADLDRTWAVDVRGTFLMCRAAHPHLVRSGEGAVVNMSSGAALEGDPAVLLYAAAKEGVHGLTKALATAWAPQVRVNALAPGSINTGWVEAWKVPAEDVQRIESRTPLRRLGEPDDVANAALYLCSSLGGFLTGQTLVVDGGVWRT
ncbi:MAG: glucose 1-dehydrogenase [Myxococcota bacterium]